MSLLPLPLAPEVLTLLETIHNDAAATRYMSGKFYVLVTFMLA